MPPVGILTTVPSINLNSACCTPSPLISFVLALDSLLGAFLSISSKNTIPCSATETSQLH